MKEQWGIYRQDNRTGQMVRFNPTIDGKPRVFRSKKAAVDFAYDYQIAGQRNTHVEFKREATREVNPRGANPTRKARGQTVEQAHAAGAADGAKGLGPAPPRTGPPGSLAHRLHGAYMQSYRDAHVARVGIPERRRNPSVRAGPKEPWHDFADWKGGGTQRIARYIVDANGHVWYHGPGGGGWSRIAGTVEEVRQRIRDGKLRGELLRTSNPRRGVTMNGWKVVATMRYHKGHPDPSKRGKVFSLEGAATYATRGEAERQATGSALMDRTLGRKDVVYSVRPARAKNPRRKVRGKTVTTVSQSKVIRRTNRRPSRPLVVLYAHRTGMHRLKYLGHGKFGERGRPMLFKTVAAAELAGWILKDTHPAALRGWTLKTS